MDIMTINSVWARKLLDILIRRTLRDKYGIVADVSVKSLNVKVEEDVSADLSVHITTSKDTVSKLIVE